MTITLETVPVDMGFLQKALEREKRKQPVIIEIKPSQLFELLYGRRNA